MDRPALRYLDHPQTDKSKSFTILHFNDVYDFLPHKSQDPIALGQVLGGADKFSTLLKSFEHLDPMITFGGDWLAPSLLSSLNQGIHMSEILEKMKVHFGALGNHDIDFGVAWLEKMTQEKALFGDTEYSRTAWFMSNIYQPGTEKPICGALEHLVFDWNGAKVGMIGLGSDWIDSTVPGEKELKYVDYIKKGEELAQFLKNTHKVDIVIAITHCRRVEDRVLGGTTSFSQPCFGEYRACHPIHIGGLDPCFTRSSLANAHLDGAPSIDLILGGHSHEYADELTTSRFIKSGQNFEFLSVVNVSITEEGIKITNQKHDCVQTIQPDPEITELQEKYKKVYEAVKNKKVGHCSSDFTLVKKKIRLTENAFANFITDLFKETLNTDIGFITGGSIASDAEWKAGDVTMGMVLTWFPWGGNITSKRVKGSDLVKACEWGVNFAPVDQGSFGHFSGLSFEWSQEKPKLARVSNVRVAGEPIDLEKMYSVASTEYLSGGGDGYDMLGESEWIVNPEGGRQIIDSLVQFLEKNETLVVEIDGRLKQIV